MSMTTVSTPLGDVSARTPELAAEMADLVEAHFWALTEASARS